MSEVVRKVDAKGRVTLPESFRERLGPSRTVELRDVEGEKVRAVPVEIEVKEFGEVGE